MCSFKSIYENWTSSTTIFLAVPSNAVWFDLEDFVVFFLVDPLFMYFFNSNLWQPIYHKPVSKIDCIHKQQILVTPKHLYSFHKGEWRKG